MYLKDFLSDSLTLGKEILSDNESKLDFWRGFTILPERVGLDEALRFEEGGKIISGDTNDARILTSNQSPVSDNLRLMLPYLKAFLAKGPNNLIICEDISAHPTDLFLQKDIDVCTFKNEVYYRCSGASRTVASIEAIVQKSNTYRLLAAGVSLPEYKMSASRILDVGFLRNCAKSTAIIITSAYDNEGYVFWELRN